jgi:hypothetical protein
MPLCRSIGVACLLALLAACTLHAARPSQATVVTGEAGVQCRNERLTGTLIARRICTTQAQRDAMASGTQATMDNLNRQPIPACPGLPGC